MNKLSLLVWGGLAFQVAACGGSPSSSPDTVLDNTIPLDADSEAASGFAFAITDLNGTSETGTGVLDRSESTFTANGFGGTYDVDSDVLTLDDGGQATFTNIQDYSAVLLVEGTGGTQFGVLGILPSEVPTGAASYTGTTELTIVDADGVYELSGQMVGVLDFGGSFNDLEVTFQDLDGTKTDGFGQPVGDVTDVAVISLNVDEVGTSGAFSVTGGASVTSDQLSTVLSGREIVIHAGSFFGPGYDEIGGVFVIDDGTTGSLEISGTYIGD